MCYTLFPAVCMLKEMWCSWLQNVNIPFQRKCVPMKFRVVITGQPEQIETCVQCYTAMSWVILALTVMGEEAKERTHPWWALMQPRACHHKGAGNLGYQKWCLISSSVRTPATLPSYSLEKETKMRQKLTVRMLLLLSLLRCCCCMFVVPINHFTRKKSGFPQNQFFSTFCK